jgi:hypothetical protein
MERQRHVCVIDWFGVNYDGTMPTILLACEENCLLYFRSRRPIPRPSSLPIGRTGQIVSIDKIARRRILRKDAYD